MNLWNNSSHITGYIAITNNDIILLAKILFLYLFYFSQDSSNPIPGGGTALVSVDSRSESLHISLAFNGIFPESYPPNSNVILELVPPSRGEGEAVPVREVSYESCITRIRGISHQSNVR